MFNVVCVWVGPKNRNHYKSDYVHRLYQGVKRNLDLEFDFWCWTDIPQVFENDPHIKTIKYTNEEKGYWAKPIVFSRDYGGPTLFIDIDVVILSDITELCNQFIKTKSPRLTKCAVNKWANSSIMYWNGLKYKEISDSFYSDIDYWKERFHNSARLGNQGDQAYTSFKLGKHRYVDEYANIIWYQSTENHHNHVLNYVESDHPDWRSDNYQFLIMTDPLHKPHRLFHFEHGDYYDSDIVNLVKTHWILE